jgi:Xaa-Pro aminopeptidase
MTFEERLTEIRRRVTERGLDRIVALHDGAHFIEKPDPVLVLSGFKSLGPCAVVLERGGRATLVVTPAWDAARAAEGRPGLRIVAVDDVAEGLAAVLDGRGATGSVGLAAMPFGIAQRVARLIPDAPPADEIVFHAAGHKIDTEIANAREAVRIAELGYRHLLDIARPGITEDELAVELRWHSKTLGAEDNFVLLCSGPHNKAVAPSHGRRLQGGDIIVVELTPSYRGQLVQICRTITVGAASETLRQKYALVVEAMHAGIAAAQPGKPMADVCRAINDVLEAKGYGEFCHPPHIRRRGHGLGFGSIEPGDVALDNPTILEPDMLFMIHPNQYLPETGYLLCGEPVLITAQGALPLTAQSATLAEIKL